MIVKRQRYFHRTFLCAPWNHLLDLPDIIEEEASENGNGDYIMTEIHETTFELKLTADKMCHSNEVAGVFPPTTLDFSLQDNQLILGIREHSVKAFWRHNDVRTPIQNLETAQSEWVNIKVKDEIVDIKFMFENPEKASYHFEFTFKSRIKIYTFSEEILI